MTRVAAWVRSLTESVTGGAPFAVGDVVRHPDGRRVKIISGRYWGTYGVSNWWTWREVDDAGTPRRDRSDESGYGWTPSTGPLTTTFARMTVPQPATYDNRTGENKPGEVVSFEGQDWFHPYDGAKPVRITDENRHLVISPAPTNSAGTSLTPGD